MLPSFLARLECDDVGVSAFLFTAMVVAVVEAAVTEAVVVDVEAAFAAVMGFIVAETAFTGKLSTFSGVLALDLKLKCRRNILIKTSLHSYFLSLSPPLSLLRLLLVRMTTIVNPHKNVPFLFR